MKLRRLLFAFFLALLFCLNLARAADWTSMEKKDGVAYFFVSSPAKIERYDIASRAWLTPFTLPSTRGPLTAGTIDADGIYVAFDKSVYRYNLTGANETHLINIADKVEGLFTDGNLLLINSSVSLYARVTSISKATNTVIATMENYIDAIAGASISRSNNRLLGTSRGVSPADVTYVEYRDDGTFVGGGDSPHHGDYSIGTRTWTFPNESRFLDTTGRVYQTANLSYALSFGTSVTDIAFIGNDVPVVLSGNLIVAYTNALLPAGSATLSSAAKSIIIDGESVIAFKTTAADDIATEIIALSALGAPAPGQAVNPEGLAYVPDEVFTDSNGILHFFSKAHQTIFRWDPVTQSYIAGIPLIAGPDYVAYSATSNTIYTAYTSGLVRKIELNSGSIAETAFAQLPSAPLGLSTAGNYLFACDGSGAWVTHYTYHPDGRMISSVDWNYRSLNYVWNAANQKMYFFRDDTSPNDLIWEEINASGTAYPALAPGAIGTKKDSPLHSSIGFTHPIRPSADGTIIALGGGVFHDGTTLERKTAALGNSFIDAAWATNGLYSMRSISGITQFQQWLLPTYALGTVAQVPGTPRRILPLSNGTFAAVVSAADGIPSIHILNQQFGIVAPSVLAVPADLKTTVTSSHGALISWNDVGGETGYKIERQQLPDGAWQTIGTTTMGITTFNDATLQIGTTVAYRVTATNGEQSSAASAAVSLEFSPPAAPVLSATVLSLSQIKLDWSAAPRAVSYKLYRRTATSSAWTLLSSPAAGVFSFTDTYLAAGTTYQYKLQGVNALGSSPDSEIVSASTPMIAPEVPYLYWPSANGPYSAYLSWYGGARAETFEIERMTGTNGTWTPIASLGGSVFNFFDNELQPKTSYTYRIFAKNVIGVSAYSTARSVTTPDIPLPSIPANLSAQPISGSEIKLSWSDSSAENGYRIERQIGESEWTVVSSIPADTIDFSDTTVATGNYYNYRIVAFNVRGEATSATVRLQAAHVGALISEDFDPSIHYPYWTELSGAAAISGPRGFKSGNALWMSGNSLRQVSLRGVDVSMGGNLKFSFRAGNSAADGISHWDNSESGEEVVLEYAIGSGPWQYLAYLNTEFPNHSTWQSHDIALPLAARSGETRFRWYQLQHSGAGYDSWAIDDLEITGVLPSIPEAPPFLMGNASSSRLVSLSWIAGSRASSYVIQRRTPQSDWSAIGTAGAGQTYFLDESAIPATMYSYRVISRNASGDSPPSNYILVNTWSTLADWRFQNYGTLSNIGAAESMADNGSGVPNLIRFAFNMAANDQFFQIQGAGDTKGMPNIQMHSPTGRLRVAFLRRRADTNPGIQYSVEFTSDAKNWSTVGEEIVAAPIDENFEYVVWEDEESPDGAFPKRFARVRVEE